jgi:hypothetical protein
VRFHADSLEARVGIEPTHKGFADLSLTSWVPRQTLSIPELPISVTGAVWREAALPMVPKYPCCIRAGR